MHLALLIPSLDIGGAQRVLSELANYWAKKGQRITIITLQKQDSEPFYPLNPKIALIQINQSENSTSNMKRIKNILKKLYLLRKTIKQIEPQAIVSFLDIMNVTTLLAICGLNIPIVISERTDPHFYKLPRFYDTIRRWVYPYCNRLVVQTQSTAQYFPDSFKSFTTIIPNPVIFAKNLPKASSKTAQNLLSLGRLIPTKDHAILIKAFSLIAKTYPKLTLSIYGEGSERENLQKLIDDHHLQKRVFLKGVTNDVYKVLAEGDLFLFPSQYEGFPNALCEAMSVGLPVIASNCSGNVDVVEDGINGRLFPVGDVDALTKLLQELLEDEKQRERLSNNAQKITETLHPDKIYPQWDKVISEVTNPYC